MTIERETYIELLDSMLHAVAVNDLTLSQAAGVLFSCAQPTTTETAIDLTMQTRAALTDWKESDKGQLVAVETVQLRFDCGGQVHGPCEKGHHVVQMTRCIGSMGWSPEGVNSIHDFNQILKDLTIAQHPDGPGGKYVASHKKGSHDLVDMFRDLFQTNANTIDSEVKDFRAELDELFPSAPTQEKGDSDDTG